MIKAGIDAAGENISHDPQLNAVKVLVPREEGRESTAAELSVVNRELAFLIREKEKQADELSIANTELLFQNNEKEKRAAELIVANQELEFQNSEKEKRAAELIIANAELAFQNREKGKRAKELSIANIELVFQNNEKEKRAAELIVANRELAFQNAEKEKRAAELLVANEELAYQNTEKESRAAELLIANNELAFQNIEKEKRAEELSSAINELKKAEDDILTLNEELEQKVINRTAQLHEANGELESFSYSISHDLRAPLRAINGLSRILQEDYLHKLDDEGRSVLVAILTNSKRMGELIDDLLEFSRLGRKPLNLSNINMNLLVRNVMEELQFEYNEHKTVFNVGDLPHITGDKALIKQVCINLISNAIKYSANKIQAIIDISGVEKEGDMVYSVTDNGAGFHMEYYDKLFGVFQRLHSQDEFEGTGIGLAIVQKIIFRHQGKVWGTSVVGEGASFSFSLPNIYSL